MVIRRLAPRAPAALSRSLPLADAGEALACTRCGSAYQGDPTLLVACPVCFVAPGVPCCKPDHGRVRQSHLSRSRDALAAGRMPACGALTWDGLHAFAVPVPAAPRHVSSSI